MILHHVKCFLDIWNLASYSFLDWRWNYSCWFNKYSSLIREVISANVKVKGIPKSLRAFGRVLSCISAQGIAHISVSSYRFLDLPLGRRSRLLSLMFRTWWFDKGSWTKWWPPWSTSVKEHQQRNWSPSYIDSTNDSISQGIWSIYWGKLMLVWSINYLSFSFM